jgi:hypothetical protein
MFEVHKHKQTPATVIRPATCSELSNYEKRKLASIEENAQENKIEIISISIDGNKQRTEPLNKEVSINLGALALKSGITKEDISSDDIFIIQCELEEPIA